MDGLSLAVRTAALVFVLGFLPAGHAWAGGDAGQPGHDHTDSQASGSHDDHTGHAAIAAAQRYAARVVDYAPPDIPLIDATWTHHRFRQALDADHRPLVFQFIYTTCPGVCPLLSAIMVDLEHVLGERAGELRRWSISVDPENDTPEQLNAYVQDFGGSSGWQVMTGAKGDIEALQKSFDAYQDNKMDHEPLTFVWAGQGGAWLRIDGFLTAEELLAEVERFSQTAAYPVGPHHDATVH